LPSAAAPMWKSAIQLISHDGGADAVVKPLSRKAARDPRQARRAMPEDGFFDP